MMIKLSGTPKSQRRMSGIGRPPVSYLEDAPMAARVRW
jgi:hypothetical protein